MALQGVLNGIDTALWDPAKDPLLPAPYTPDQLNGKALCKRRVLCARSMLGHRTA